MLNPLLHFHYKNFITTTIKSAPYNLPTSFWYLLPLTILQNIVEFTCSLKQPMYASCQLYPECRVSSNQVADTLYHQYSRNYRFLTLFIALRGFIVGYVSFSSHTCTYRNHSFRFSLSLTTSLFPILAA